ncbi:hypothetical protein G6F57_014223 [Rhizopus arrhizus]|nr:hypothetical protein G6F57_014223 [Rhizopus arrhizus]
MWPSSRTAGSATPAACTTWASPARWRAAWSTSPTKPPAPGSWQSSPARRWAISAMPSRAMPKASVSAWCASGALRPPGPGPGAAAGHDLHHRADDQRGHPLQQGAAGRLDRGDQGPQAVGAVGAHDRGHRDRRGCADSVAGRVAGLLRMLPASSLLDTPAASLIDPDWAAAARQALQQADARLYRRFDQGDNIERLLALRARAADHLIRLAWQRCLPADSGLSLFAVGGYGRGELFPRSDIDLLVFGEPPAQLAHEPALARLFALLWDCGLAVSHAVRSAAQCREAAADQTVLTALIEARPILAEEATRRALREAIDDRELWPARAFFLAKLEELRNRHQRFGDTADNLEPDLKDGPGGLRDLNTLGWMALRAFGVRDLEALVGLGHLGADEAAALKRERAVLARLRFGLHLVARRPEERLRFDYQKTLAARLGFEDDAENLGRPPAAALRGTVRRRGAAGTADRGLFPAPRLPGGQ